jgi:hypothetical protein
MSSRHFASSEMHKFASSARIVWVKKKKNFRRLSGYGPSRSPKEGPSRPCTWSLLHRGIYNRKTPPHLKQCGYSVLGKHHEIYLNASDRTALERLKTILQQLVSQ